mgnify:CR=1 FL=1
MKWEEEKFSENELNTDSYKRHLEQENVISSMEINLKFIINWQQILDDSLRQ